MGRQKLSASSSDMRVGEEGWHHRPKTNYTGSLRPGQRPSTAHVDDGKGKFDEKRGPFKCQPRPTNRYPVYR